MKYEVTLRMTLKSSSDTDHIAKQTVFVFILPLYIRSKTQKATRYCSNPAATAVIIESTSPAGADRRREMKRIFAGTSGVSLI